MGNKSKVSASQFIQTLQNSTVAHVTSLPAGKATTTIVEYDNGSVMQVIEAQIDGKNSVSVYFFLDSEIAVVEIEA